MHNAPTSGLTLYQLHNKSPPHSACEITSHRTTSPPLRTHSSNFPFPTFPTRYAHHTSQQICRTCCGRTLDSECSTLHAAQPPNKVCGAASHARNAIHEHTTLEKLRLNICRFARCCLEFLNMGSAFCEKFCCSDDLSFWLLALGVATQRPSSEFGT